MHATEFKCVQELKQELKQQLAVSRECSEEASVYKCSLIWQGGLKFFKLLLKDPVLLGNVQCIGGTTYS